VWRRGLELEGSELGASRWGAGVKNGSGGGSRGCRGLFLGVEEEVR
jgi:hypothetical protein